MSIYWNEVDNDKIASHDNMGRLLIKKYKIYVDFMNKVI